MLIWQMHLAIHNPTMLKGKRKIDQDFLFSNMQKLCTSNCITDYELPRDKNHQAICGSDASSQYHDQDRLNSRIVFKHL